MLASGSLRLCRGEMIVTTYKIMYRLYLKHHGVAPAKLNVFKMTFRLAIIAWCAAAVV